MTKKIFLLILCIILAMTITVAILSACDNDDVSLVSIELSPDSPSEIVVGKFDISKFSIIKLYSDGSTKTIPMTEDMISSADLLKLYHDGNQTVTFKVDQLSFDYTIAVKRYEITGVELPDKTYTYDGKVHSLDLRGAVPEGADIQFPNGNKFTNAGTYYITAVISSDIYVTKSFTGILTIERAPLDISGVTFEDISYYYDGNEKDIKIGGKIPSGLRVNYTIGKAETNAMINVGVYTCIAHFDGGPNYLPLPDKEATLTIEKGYYDISAIKFPNRTETYNSEPHSIFITNSKSLPSGVTVFYEGNNQITAGVYTITAFFTGDTNNYHEIEPLTATLTIQKADIIMKGVYLDSKSFVYDKKPHELSIEGELPSGIEFNGYENNKQTDVGLYTVYAKFTYRDTINYNPISPLTATLEITKAEITGVKFEDKTYTWDGFGHSLYATNYPNGITVTYDNNGQKEPGSYDVTATFKLSEQLSRNYEPLSPMSAKLHITKKELGADFTGTTVEYDGSAHYIYASGYPAWVTVTYENNGKTLPGSYIVVANFKVEESMLEYANTYYEIEERLNASLVISKKNWVPTFTNQKLSYTGENQTVTIDTTKLPAALKNGSGQPLFTCTYTGNTQKEIGFYTAVCTVDLDDSVLAYYNQPAPITFYYAIRGVTKNVYTPEVVGNTATYDGEMHYVSINNLPFGIEVEYLRNGIVDPGDYKVTALFSFTNEIAEYYWTLPSDYKTDVSGKPYKQISLFIAKQDYEVKYNVGPYVYDGTNKSVTAKGLPSWISISYQYETAERIIPGYYTLVATPKIDPASEQYKYYDCKASNLTMIITKANATYGFDALSAKYDGNDHRVSVTGLPEGFVVTYTYYTETQEVVSGYPRDVGTYYVKIVFNNVSNPCYNDISAQLVAFVIEKNYVEIRTLSDYCNSFTSKRIDQFTSVKDLLSSLVDITAMLISWKVDYYDTNGNIYDDSFTNRHGQGNQDNDFAFDEYTNGNEYCLCFFSLTLKEGYVFDDATGSTTFSNSIQLTVGKTEKIDIIPLSLNLSGNISLPQGSTLVNTINNYIPTESYSIVWSADYYYGETLYSEIYTDCHGNNNDLPTGDFTFSRSTWGNRYCAITYTLTSKTGYRFYNGIKSSTTYQGAFNCEVTPQTTIDLKPLRDVVEGDVSVPQYTTVDDFLKEYIDYNNVDVSWELYRKTSSGEMQSLATSANGFSLYTASQKELRINLTVEVGKQYIFNDSSYYINYSREFDVTVTPRSNIDIQSATSTIETHVEKQIDQYSRYFDDVIGNSFVCPEHVAYTWHYENGDTKVDGVMGEELDIDTPTAENTFATMTFTFYPKDGYVFVNEYMADIGNYTITLSYSVRPITKVNVSSIIAHAGGEDDYIYVKQYSTFTEDITKYIDNILALDTTYFSLSYTNISAPNATLGTVLWMTTNGDLCEDIIFNKTTDSGIYILVEVTLTLAKEGNYVFDLNRYSFNYDCRNRLDLQFKYRVTSRPNVDRYALNDLNNAGRFDADRYDYFLEFYESISEISVTDYPSFTYTMDYVRKTTLESIFNGVSDCHKTGSEANDFAFTYSTSDIDNATVLVKMTFKVKDGYCVLDNNGIGCTTWDVQYTIDVAKRIAVDQTKLLQAESNGINVTQFDLLVDSVKDLFSEEDFANIRYDWIYFLINTNTNYLTYQKTGTYDSDYRFGSSVSAVDVPNDYELAYITLELNRLNNYCFLENNTTGRASTGKTINIPIKMNALTFIDLTEYTEYWAQDVSYYWAVNPSQYTESSYLYNQLTHKMPQNTKLVDIDFIYVTGGTEQHFTNIAQSKNTLLNAGTYKIYLKLECAEGYYFGLDSQGATIKTWEIGTKGDSTTYAVRTATTSYAEVASVFATSMTDESQAFGFIAGKHPFADTTLDSNLQYVFKVVAPTDDVTYLSFSDFDKMLATGIDVVFSCYVMVNGVSTGSGTTHIHDIEDSYLVIDGNIGFKSTFYFYVVSYPDFSNDNLSRNFNTSLIKSKTYDDFVVTYNSDLYALTKQLNLEGLADDYQYTVYRMDDVESSRVQVYSGSTTSLKDSTFLANTANVFSSKTYFADTSTINSTTSKGYGPYQSQKVRDYYFVYITCNISDNSRLKLSDIPYSYQVSGNKFLIRAWVWADAEDTMYVGALSQYTSEINYNFAYVYDHDTYYLRSTSTLKPGSIIYVNYSESFIEDFLGHYFDTSKIKSLTVLSGGYFCNQDAAIPLWSITQQGIETSENNNNYPYIKANGDTAAVIHDVPFDRFFGTQSAYYNSASEIWYNLYWINVEIQTKNGCYAYAKKGSSGSTSVTFTLFFSMTSADYHGE